MRSGSTTTRLPTSLSACAETTSATAAASLALEKRSSSSRITPRTPRRWRMTISPKSRDVLIRGKAHHPAARTVSCCMVSAANAKRRAQVVLGQLRVGFEHLSEGAARAQLAQDKLHRDARAFDARFTHHHGGIGGNAGVCHGILLSRGSRWRMIARRAGERRAQSANARDKENGSTETYSLSSVIAESLGSQRWMTPMLDNPDKTARLLTALKAAVPFEVELAPAVIKQLQSENLACADQTQRTVSNLSYAGDAGGILCHIVSPNEQRALVISLTSRQDGAHHASCGGSACLSEASSEEAQEAGARELIAFPAATAVWRVERRNAAVPRGADAMKDESPN